MLKVLLGLGATSYNFLLLLLFFKHFPKVRDCGLVAVLGDADFERALFGLELFKLVFKFDQGLFSRVDLGHQRRVDIVGEGAGEDERCYRSWVLRLVVFGDGV